GRPASSLDVPDLRSAVLTAGREPSAIGGESDRATRTFNSQLRLSRLSIQDLQLVTSPQGDQPAAGAKRHRTRTASLVRIPDYCIVWMICLRAFCQVPAEDLPGETAEDLFPIRRVSKLKSAMVPGPQPAFRLPCVCVDDPGSAMMATRVRA